MVVQLQQIFSILSHHPVSAVRSLARLFLSARDTPSGQEGQYVPANLGNNILGSPGQGGEILNRTNPASQIRNPENSNWTTASLSAYPSNLRFRDSNLRCRIRPIKISQRYKSPIFSLERIVSLTLLYRHPLEFGHRFHRPLTAFAGHAGVFHTAERNVRLVMNCRTVDVHHSCFEA